jgi:hypothetical protein
MEKIHLKFCKRILNVRLTTPSYMVYGALGRYPLEIRVKLRMVSFWTKLVHRENKRSSILYRLMLQIHQVEIMILNGYLLLSQFCIILVLAIFLPTNWIIIYIHWSCFKRTLIWSVYSAVVYRYWKFISWWILLDLQIWIWIWEILIKIISEK